MVGNGKARRTGYPIFGENDEKAQLRERMYSLLAAAFRDDRVDMQLKFKQGASVARDGGHDNRG